ncbi:MAG: Stk1 family PASTA domain-containing Ser/Thr kinase [Clostridia bacterium]|nr:Stk1 family PASTA domain-containing Ser/Thr kinase [Clostridia bacterium]
MENYVGKRLDGRYEIRDVVGVGGMAVVYKAYDNIDDRIVAVKILKDEYLTNEEFRRRFKNESKAIAVLSHKNIVKVFDVSFGDRLQYIVMEYIEGVTLKEYIEQRGVIDWNEALFFSIQILRALQHAHDKGIVHRDVKPQNIMLLENGTIKVTDFGIARFSHSETRTMTEKAIGSVHYISPEQAKGELTDEKADLYSIGVVLYEMLTGKLPFEAESAVSVALMQVNNDPALPRSINPNIPIGFEQITMKAMQKSTRDRYQTASEVLYDLEELRMNPSIKFDYQTYFVDNEPTRYIGKIQETNRPATNRSRAASANNRGEGVRTVPPSQDIRRKVDGVRERERTVNTAVVTDEKAGLTNKTIAILFGIGFLVLTLIIVGFFALLKSDNFTLGVKRKVEVANFVGLNYEEEIKDNPLYNENFNFEKIYESFSDGEEGAVFKQDPEAGTEVSKGTTIRIYIVQSGESVALPDFSGQDYRTVSDELESMGFNVSLVAKENDSVDSNKVIKTDPAADSMVPVGSTVTVYYAVSAKSDALFKMPSLKGKKLEDVKEILEDKGLNIGEIEVVDSSEKKDVVIDQSPVSGSPVSKGDTVDLVISSGRSVVEKTITLPSRVGKVTVKVVVDGETVKNETVDTNSKSSYTFVVGGDKANVPVKVYIDGQLYYEAIGDFSKNPGKLSKEKNYDVSFYVDVVGLPRAEAEKALRDAGYYNINIQTAPSTEKPGTVISQTPKYSSAANLDTSTIIVLTIAEEEKTTKAPSTTSAPAIEIESTIETVE